MTGNSAGDGRHGWQFSQHPDSGQQKAATIPREGDGRWVARYGDSVERAARGGSRRTEQRPPFGGMAAVVGVGNGRTRCGDAGLRC